MPLDQLEPLKTKRGQLNKEFNKNNPNLEKCGQLLDELKVDLTELIFLPITGQQVSNEELHLALDILETGAKYSISTKNTKAFERYMSQLKTYYADYEDRLALESASKYELLGLHLLCLLSQNRVAEFHTEVELLPPDKLQSNVYVRTPVELEQYIMEGSYNKVRLAKDNVPSPYYTHFIDCLLEAIRDEIASCMEKAYERISLSECARMLNLDSGAVEPYVVQRGWALAAGQFVSFKVAEKKSSESEVPAHELAQMAITYAKEMEKIV
jgi:26S proteasome regulatory subunit N12